MKENHLKHSYWLCRIIILRYLCFLYFIAFLIAYHQNEGLIGTNGLTSAEQYLEETRERLKDLSSFQIFQKIPTIFWYLVPTDLNLNCLACLGMIISLRILWKGAANSIMLFLLWIFYLSIVNVGQTWYSFGWESLLLEIGFLSIFTVPIFQSTQFPILFPFPLVTMFGYKWIIFRLMFGAGMIKIRGDNCWQSPALSCLFYHYETQPVPNPLSPYLHLLPLTFHRFEVISNHFIELICPFLLLLPISFSRSPSLRYLRIFSSLIQICFQVILILSGNLSFLNWLTILPCIVYLDDHFLSQIIQFPSSSLEIANYLNRLSSFSTLRYLISHVITPISTSSRSLLTTLPTLGRSLLHLVLFCLLFSLSIPVVTNLLSSHQVMNTSYDSFRLLNTYGAFGSVTRRRYEVILQGTYLQNVTFSAQHSLYSDTLPPIWLDYHFRCKPGDISRKPCLISPYHYRLDWLMWFAPFSSYRSVPWLVHLSVKLLREEWRVMRLLDESRNNDIAWRLAEKYEEMAQQLLGNQRKEIEGMCGGRITHIRAQLYEYEYSINLMRDKETLRIIDEGKKENLWKGEKSEEVWEEGIWWRRREIGSYLPVVSLEDPSVKTYLKHYGWK